MTYYLLYPFRILFNFFIKIIIGILDQYLPHVAFITTLFCALILVLIDSLTSYLAYIKVDGLEDIKSQNFASKESYSAILDILWTVTFIYLVKTDGRFIDKFIELLKVLQSTVTNTKNKITDKLGAKIK